MSSKPMPGDYAAKRGLRHDEALFADEMELPEEVIGDGPCEDCGADNLRWFTLNVVWNQVMGEEQQRFHNEKLAGVICIHDFVRRAHAVGISPTWLLLPAVDIQADSPTFTPAEEPPATPTCDKHHSTTYSTRTNSCLVGQWKCTKPAGHEGDCGGYVCDGCPACQPDPKREAEQRMIDRLEDPIVERAKYGDG